MTPDQIAEARATLQAQIEAIEAEIKSATQTKRDEIKAIRKKLRALDVLAGGSS